MFVSGIVNPLPNSRCCRNLLRPTNQTVSISVPENLLGALAPYLASIPVGSHSKYVLKNYIDERKMY